MSWILNHIEEPSTNSANVDDIYAQEISNQLGHKIFPIRNIYLEKDTYSAEDLHISKPKSSLYISERGQYIIVPVKDPAYSYSITIDDKTITRQSITYGFNAIYAGHTPNNEYIILYIEYKPQINLTPCVIDIYLRPYNPEVE